jgi:hypothetical protein
MADTPVTPDPSTAPDNTPVTLAQKVRAAHPGAYDDMDDPSLESAVISKYPQYKDLATPNINLAPAAKAPVPTMQGASEPVPASLLNLPSNAYHHPLDTLIGAAKGIIPAIQSGLPSAEQSTSEYKPGVGAVPRTPAPAATPGGVNLDTLFQASNPAQESGSTVPSLIGSAAGLYQVGKGLLGKPNTLPPGQPAEANDLTGGQYTKPGSKIAASLRSNARIDVPAVASDAHPAIAEGLADRGLSAADFKGRSGPLALQSGIDNALDIHEARAKAIIDPIRSQPVDPQELAKNPELAARFTPEQLKKGVTFGDLDEQRLALNKALKRSGLYVRDPSAQYAAADPLADMDAAANQARQLVYDKAQAVTGVDVRPIKNTESNLIKLGDIAETTKNTLSAKAAQHEATPFGEKAWNSIKSLAAAKANPISSFFSYEKQGLASPLNEFNRNMQSAFGDVKAAPGSVLKNGRLIEPGPAVLTPPPGQTPPEPNRQLPLTLDPEAPGYELTPPAGKTPPEIQPRQQSLPLAPGEAIPGPQLKLQHPEGVTPPEPDRQEPLDFTADKLKQAAANAAQPERRAASRPKPMNATELDAAMKNRKPINTPFDVTEGAMNTINRDPNMPEMPGRLKAAINNGSGESSASVESIKRMASEKAAGTQRVVVDTRSGAERPLIGPDAVDYTPKKFESVEFRGGNKDGEIISQGPQVRRYTRK